MKNKKLWKWIVSFNIIEGLYFLITQIVLITSTFFIATKLGIDSRATIEKIYSVVPLSNLFAGLLIFVLTIIGLIGIFKNTYWGKIIIILTSLIYLINEVSDALKISSQKFFIEITIQILLILAGYVIISRVGIFNQKVESALIESNIK